MIQDKRCVHLDFHTSDEIEGIGEAFDKKEFIETLKTANLDSISVFAKCHHGCLYYYSDKYYTHPHLVKPLLDEQLEACKEAGVSAKIYISAGFDEHCAMEHPEWLRQFPDGTRPSMVQPGFKKLCFNTPYMDVLLGQTKEVMERYKPDGIFFDIVTPETCTCTNCMADMKKKGLDYRKWDDLMTQAWDVFHEYCQKLEKVIHDIRPDTLIFHNTGDFPVSKISHEKYCDQLETESLPTGGWGYDHFPMKMSYIRRLGKNCIGMTGKFHQAWGEFGGYKYENALIYEGAQCLAFGAGLNVGDQLHPSGKPDKYTYEAIGKAMAYVKEREAYKGGEYLPELAVYSQCENGGRNGIGRMLFEGKYLFDLICKEEISNKYPLIILPDCYELSNDSVVALKEYVKNGGKILAFGAGGMNNGKIPFDLGAEVVDKDDNNLTYIRAHYPLEHGNGSAMVVYSDTRYYSSFHIKATGKVLADRIDPYFKREGLHFCSHNNIPYDENKKSPAITEGKDGIFVCASLTNDYFDVGSMNDKQLTLPLIDKLLGGKKTIRTNLPSSGKITLYEKDNKYYLHMVYANIVKRGKTVEAIEDLPTLADINVTLDLPKDIKKAICRPSGKELVLTKKDGNKVTFALDRLCCSEIIELIY